MLWNPWAIKTSALISFVFVVTDQRIPSEQTMILLLKSFLTRCFNYLYISYLSNSFIFCFITTIWRCTFHLLTSVCSVPECQILLCEVMNFLSLIHFTSNVCVCMFFLNCLIFTYVLNLLFTSNPTWIILSGNSNSFLFSN